MGSSASKSVAGVEGKSPSSSRRSTPLPAEHATGTAGSQADSGKSTSRAQNAAQSAREAGSESQCHWRQMCVSLQLSNTKLQRDLLLAKDAMESERQQREEAVGSLQQQLQECKGAIEAASMARAALEAELR